MNSEMIKLVVILVIGLLVMSIGPLYARYKKKKAVSLNTVQGSSMEYSSILTENETKAKTYIETYKNSYSKESILQGLIVIGMSSSEAQSYLDKYF